MKFLTDAKTSKFASELLAKAGFKLEEFMAAGDVNALNAAREAEIEAAIKEATEENEKLSARITALEAGDKLSATKLAAVESLGLKIEVGADGTVDAEKLKADYNLQIAKESRIALARAGHVAIDPELKEQKEKKVKDKAPEGAVGQDRYRHAFDKQISRLRRSARNSGDN